jgi:hypothetical protein
MSSRIDAAPLTLKTKSNVMTATPAVSPFAAVANVGFEAARPTKERTEADLARIGNVVVDLIVDIARKKATPQSAIDSLKKIAAGQDATLGTSDDTLDAHTLEMLTWLIETGVAQRIVDLVLARVTGFDLKRLCCFGG